MQIYSVIFALKYIDKFEKQNPENAINVLCYSSFIADTFEKDYIFPLKISDMEDRKHTVDLLFLEKKLCFNHKFEKIISRYIMPVPA